jgi:tetratricopeptide (TPR) repeat protein
VIELVTGAPRTAESGYARPMDPFFGREHELSRLAAALARAKQGQGALVVLSGEAGIGKSRLAKELEAQAREQGAAVAWGRCWEAGGAPAFWPWMQIFRTLGRDPFAELEHAPDPNQRFVLFDAATRVLRDAGRETPRLLVLDDLHVADVPSLLLLLFVARELGGMGVLVVASLREAHPVDAETGALLAKIRREAEVLLLPRLTLDEVTAWASARSAPGAERLYRVSEGNPLFVEELLRVGLGKAALQGALGAVIDEHLSGLSARARSVLDAASVLGREFSLPTLNAAFGFDRDELVEDAGEAVAKGVLVSSDPRVYVFSHALLRDRLYESLPPTRRAALHWQAGSVTGEGATQAHHLLEGHTAGSRQVAAETAALAAGNALARLAYEETISLTRRARPVTPRGSALECELDLLEAEALIWTGKAVEGRALCKHAAVLAAELDSSALMARTALVYGTDFIASSVDRVMVELLEAALARLPPEPSALRVRVMARLAAALSPPVNDLEATRIVAMARGALAMARAVGEQEALLYACNLAGAAVSYIVGFEERAALVSDAVALARELGQRLPLQRVSGTHIVMLVEQGRRAEANVELRAFEELTEELPRVHRSRLLALKSVLALLDQRIDDATRLADEARQLGNGSSPSEAHWGLQRIAIAQATGNASSIAPHADELLRIGAGKRGPSLVGWILAGAGKRGEAIARLETTLGSEYGFPEVLWAGSACVLVEEPRLAARVYPDLAAEKNRVYWGPGGSSVFGPTSRVLGDLALLLGRRDEAAAHYDQAISLCRAMGAKPLLELALRGREACGTPAAAARPPPRPAELSLQREGELWLLELGGSSLRLKNSKGLSYLEQLVLHAGRELHVLVLVGAEHADGDAGAILDARAKAQYQERIQLLDDRIELARSLGDERGVAKARSELDAVAEQLARAVGLGGRDRRAASNVERARINVQRRLKDTIAVVSAQDAALGRYLQATVNTGTFCSFIPL